MVKKNVLGKKLEVCSLEPLTGYFRDGSCTHCETDSGQHTLCAEMTDEFYNFQKKKEMTYQPLGQNLISLA